MATTPSAKSETKKQPSGDLAEAVNRLAEITERHNRLYRHLFKGIALGVGTAVGASVVASLLIVPLARLLEYAGITTAR